MRKLIANIICGFIPSKETRRHLRALITFGPIRLLILKIKETKIKKFPNFLSVLAIAKNEGSYLKEWIEFHKIIGVEKFYIYDNESTDNTREILQPYIDNGIVEYKYWPGEGVQMQAYTDCITKHKMDTKWLAIIDLDEFLAPSANTSVTDFLRSIKSNVKQIVVGWVIYGSSGFETKPNGLVIENFTLRNQNNWLYKSICNPRFVSPVQNYSPHLMFVFGKTIDEKNNIINASQLFKNKTARFSFDIIRINHYHCKSWQEYSLRKSRGAASKKNSGGKYSRETFDLHNKNEVFDPVLVKYTPAVNKAISNFK